MINTLLDDFFWRALLGGIGLALIAGPLGCFVVWRRMAYFGDTLAHSALLGVALGSWLQLNLNVGIGLVCAAIAFFLVALSRQQSLATDTLLGILSHSALALGLVALSLMETVSFDLNNYLFGDLLAITRGDLGWIWGSVLLVLALLMRFWRPLLMTTIHEELARVEGVAVEPLRLLLMLMIALVIAIAMKIVGVLLITALLIIPAASVRRLVQTPEAMALGASLAGIFAILAGLGMSWWLNTPAGPSIVVAAFSGFLLLFLAAPRLGVRAQP